MTLMVDELYPDVVFKQNFRIKKSLSVAHIRPWFYKHGNPSTGKLVLNVYQGLDLLKTVEIDHEYINLQIPGTYAHGQLRIDTAPLQLNHNTANEWTEYSIELYMENYVKDVSNFYGLIRRYENQFYPVYGAIDGDQAINDAIEALGFEIYHYTY